MRLNELSLKERLLLARRAELRCAERLLDLSVRIDPPDSELARRLREMVAEEESHASELSRFDARVPWPLVWRLDERSIDRMLADGLPALVAEPGPDTAAADCVRNVVGAIEDESVRFYRGLAAVSADEDSRRLFTSLAEREEAHRPG